MSRKRKIVVIEDEAPIRRGIVDGLTFAGYEAIEANAKKDGDTETAQRARICIDGCGLRRQEVIKALFAEPDVDARLGGNLAEFLQERYGVNPVFGKS